MNDPIRMFMINTDRSIIPILMAKFNPFRPSGFSLIELVIVIVILAVLAVVVLPRLNRGSRSAGASALKRDLIALRSAIELYAAEHDGKYPDANIVLQLTGYSDTTGTNTHLD